jgi:hypothetical protein
MSHNIHTGEYLFMFHINYLGVPHKVQFYFFAMSQFDWPIAKKKIETMEASHNRNFCGTMECLLLWPTYIGEKGRTLGKTYGIKARCYWEHPWGTHWELEGNMPPLLAHLYR